MKNYNVFYIAIILVILSCRPMNTSIGLRQVYTDPTLETYKNKPLPSLDIILQEPQQEFIISSNVDTTLYGKYGTVIYFNANCLLTQTSLPYHGSVHVQLKELYTKHALLRERAYTISNGSMLESDGALYIYAETDLGKDLFISCAEGIKIQIPKEVKANMIYFDGKKDLSGNMNWEVSVSITSLLKINLDYYEDEARETNYPQNYFFRAKKFGWINCDRFYDDSREKTDLIGSFILPIDEKKIIESHNYIVFDSLMCILPINLDEFGQWVCPSLPVGEHITCISIQKSDTRIYYGFQKTKIGNNGFFVSMKAVKEQELENLLKIDL